MGGDDHGTRKTKYSFCVGLLVSTIALHVGLFGTEPFWNLDIGLLCTWLGKDPLIIRIRIALRALITEVYPSVAGHVAVPECNRKLRL